MIADYLGNRLVDAGATAGTVSATLSLAKLNRYRAKFPAWKDADTFQLTDPAG
jgi:predicted amidohydrolase